MSLGLAIKEARINRNYTQEAVKATRYCSGKMISAIERGGRLVKFDVLESTIEEQCFKVHESNYKDMSQKNKEEYNLISREANIILEKLQNSFNIEQREMFYKYMDMETNKNIILENFMYKSGIMDGLSELHFI